MLNLGRLSGPRRDKVKEVAHLRRAIQYAVDALWPAKKKASAPIRMEFQTLPGPRVELSVRDAALYSIPSRPPKGGRLFCHCSQRPVGGSYSKLSNN